MALPEACLLDHFSAKKAVWLFIRAFAPLKAQEQKDLLALRQASTGAETIYQLVQAFLRIVHHLQGDQLDAWIAKVTASQLKALQRFAKGLPRDKAAVLVGLTRSYNNGQTEGQVTRIKLIKRMMYGRAGFALLRQRVLPRFVRPTHPLIASHSLACRSDLSSWGNGKRSLSFLKSNRTNSLIGGGTQQAGSTIFAEEPHSRTGSLLPACFKRGQTGLRMMTKAKAVQRLLLALPGLVPNRSPQVSRCQTSSALASVQGHWVAPSTSHHRPRRGQRATKKHANFCVRCCGASGF